MELAVIVLTGYGVWRLCRWLIVRIRERRRAAQEHVRLQADQQAAAVRQKQAAEARDQALRHRLRSQNRLMQMALLQIDEAPDFYRAASFAAQAKEVPRDFRQQQFKRFRPRIVAHTVAQLRRSASAGPLRDSLEQLVEHLGVASFEADYIWQEAERQLARRETPRTTFAEAMGTLQHEHDQRMSVLRSLPGIEEELREQLLEAEEQRFRDQMLARNEEPAQHRAEHETT